MRPDDRRAGSGHAHGSRLATVLRGRMAHLGRRHGGDFALRAGASGFLLKDTQPAELPQALRIVMRGDLLLAPAVTRRLISEFVTRPPDPIAAAGMETLTNREREIVAMAAHGLSNGEIAATVVLSPTTAKTQVSRAMVELGACDRAQLVVFAHQAGLVSPREAAPRG
jgi:DNA-binding NarL/FixJ family response regulator